MAIPAEIARAIRLSGLLRKQLNLFPPVDLVQVAIALGVVVMTKPLPPDVEGYYLAAHGGRLIVINSYSRHTRQRFTLAHELAHCALAIGPISPIRLIPSPDSASTHAACNAFAVELLTPADLFRAKCTHLQARPVHAILCSLEQTFGVSREALLRRLTELSLIEGIMQQCSIPRATL